MVNINPLNAELNPICHLLALLGAHLILHVSRIRVKINTTRMHKFGKNVKPYQNSGHQKVTRNKAHTEDTQTLGITVQNAVATAPSRPGLVHPLPCKHGVQPTSPVTSGILHLETRRTVLTSTSRLLYLGIRLGGRHSRYGR